MFRSAKDIHEDSPWEDLTPGAEIYEPATSRLVKTGEWRVETPDWNSQKCRQCMLCVPYCPDSAIKVVCGKMNGMEISNMSFQTRTRSMHLHFNVAYGTDIEKAMEMIAGAVRSSKFSVPGKKGGSGPEYGPVYFIQYADSSLVLATTVYYEPETPTEVVKSDINSRVKLALEENGIEIPYQYINIVVNEAGRVRNRS